MPVEFMFTETQPVRCLEIKVPVVVAEAEMEKEVDNSITLPELAIKVDKIIASVRDLKGTAVFFEEDEVTTGPSTVEQFGGAESRRVIVKKVVVTGTLHKQIFYVNKNNEVRHTSEDIAFSKIVEFKEPRRVIRKRDVFIDFKHIDLSVNFELQRASRLHQTVVVSVTVKVVEDRQIFVQTCPRPKECPAGNLVRDGGFEAWADPTHPIFWGASNVAQATVVHSGSFSADLGRLNTLLPGSLFQMVHRGIVGGRQYRLTFWVKENIFGANVSAFNLNAEVVFFDERGVQIGIGSQSVASTAIPDTAFSQVQFITPRADENVASAMVRFTYTPSPGNTNTAKVDDVMLECVPMM